MKTFKPGDKVKVSSKSIRVLSGFLQYEAGVIIGFKGSDGGHSAIVQYSPTYGVEVRISDLEKVL